MKFEELKKGVLELSPNDRLRLMWEVGPKLCESMTGNPDTTAQMMPQCREMMGRHPEMMARMREMMSCMRGPEGPGSRGK